MSEKSDHWNAVYGRRAVTEVSWFQEEATASLALILTHARKETAIVDVGAGASTLVDGLLAQGYLDITLLDIAENAFANTRERLGDAVSDRVKYVVSDVTAWKPPRTYGLWHDRAVFHFLTSEADRAAYREVLAAAVAPNGHVIIATFSLEGPAKCSGLPVCRYSGATLAAEFAGLLRLEEEQTLLHVTPSGGSQSFLFGRFSRG